MESLGRLSIPTKKDERWRHTDLHAMFAQVRSVLSNGGEVKGDRLPVDGCKLDISNGHWTGNKQLTKPKDGVMYGSLRAAMNECGEMAERHYNTLTDSTNEAMAAMNGAFADDGAFIYVAKGVQAEQPFVVTFEYDAAGGSGMCFPRLLVILEEGARADIVISHQQHGGGTVVANFVRECFVAEGATMNLSEVTQMNAESVLISGDYVTQNADSRANMMNVWLRGGATRVNAVTDLCGAHCESNLYGLWFGTGRERTDVNMRVNHMAADCNSFELVKGVMSGESVGAFTGMVYVARDAQRTVALQQSRNLLMSEEARVYTEPQLEIYADDVKCSHGATVGQMDTEAVFYMRQRGLSEEDARRLQMFGFVNDIISRCPHAGACDFMARLAEERIAEL